MAERRRSLHAKAIDNLSQAGAKVIGFDILFADNSADDSILAEAIERSGKVVLVAAGTTSLAPTQSQIIYSEFLLPLASLRQVSLSLGHANMPPDTDGVVMIGEIGGAEEQEAAEYIKSDFAKPVAALVVGQTAPPGKRMGHAGAIITGAAARADEKVKALAEAGVTIVPSPGEIGETVKRVVPQDRSG